MNTYDNENNTSKTHYTYKIQEKRYNIIKYIFNIEVRTSQKEELIVLVQKRNEVLHPRFSHYTIYIINKKLEF